MTQAGAQIAGLGGAAEPARAWQAVRASGDIQFAPVPLPKPTATPGWLRLLGEWLRALLEPIGRAIGISWPVLEKLLIALAALLVLVLVWRVAAPWIAALRARRPKHETDWVPSPAAARALLEEADRLAGEGRFGEAAHLLLRRSVEHIGEARPEWLQPASTAREIASLAALPERARAAFAAIAARVERSLFALRQLERADWQAARAAYAEFALADLTA